MLTPQDSYSVKILNSETLYCERYHNTFQNFFFFGEIGVWTQGLVLESRCSIACTTLPVHFALVILEMGS
jgi:hypothetical protein